MSKSLFVDRIEGATAVLSDEAGRHAELPAAWLPAGLGEGQWLTLSLAADPEKTASVGERVASARAALSGDDEGGDFAI